MSGNGRDEAPVGPAREVIVRRPTVSDGAAVWALAADAGMDQNSSYAYLLWCRDFAATSTVATDGGEIVGYVTGYRRPDAPESYFVWQVATAESHRGRGLARRMIADVLETHAEVRSVEATITVGNDASRALFTRVATDRDTAIVESPLFDTSHFPDGHESEVLLTVGPW